MSQRPLHSGARWTIPRLLSAALLLAVFVLPSQPASTVPAGFRILAEVDKAISSHSAKVGETVTLICVQSIEAQDGTVFIPLGSRLLGKVVAVQKYKTGRQARLSLRIETAKWSGGEARLYATVVTIVSVGKTITRLGPGSPPTMNEPAASQQPSEPDVMGRPRNYDVRTTTGTVRVREPSEGEKRAKGLSRSPSPHTEMVSAPVPDSWGLEKVDDPSISSAITVDDADVVLTPGSRLVFKTR